MIVAERENACTAVAELTLDELQDEIATLASHIYAGTCRWLELVAEFDRRGCWATWGCPSCAQWLAWRCGIGQRTAREHVRVSRALEELPLIHAAFARGELSYAKVRALTRVAEPETEEELLELARAMTASQLERALRGLAQVSTDDADTLQRMEYFGWTWEPDGAFVFRGRLTPEDGALFLRALEASRDSLRERAREAGGGSAEPRTEAEGVSGVVLPAPRPTSAEAFVAMAETALSVTDAGGSAAERNQVVVHVDQAVLASDGEGGCALEDGPALAPETARRLSCDSSLVQITELEGEPLSVGRKTRTIPPALRRALRARDRCCRFPGCENYRFVDAHHIRHWAQGGETAIDNLVLLCRRHHRYVHEGRFSLEQLSDGALRFRNHSGLLIDAVPRPPPGDADRLLEDNRSLGIHAWTCEGGTGERMDLGLAVDALIQISRARDRSSSGGGRPRCG